MSYTVRSEKNDIRDEYHPSAALVGIRQSVNFNFHYLIHGTNLAMSE